jgi:hypothetical protein
MHAAKDTIGVLKLIMGPVTRRNWRTTVATVICFGVLTGTGLQNAARGRRTPTFAGKPEEPSDLPLGLHQTGSTASAGWHIKSRASTKSIGRLRCAHTGEIPTARFPKEVRTAMKHLSFAGAAIAIFMSLSIDSLGWWYGTDSAKAAVPPLALFFLGLVASILSTSIISSIGRLPSGRNFMLGVGIGLCAILASAVVDVLSTPTEYNRAVDVFGWGMAVGVVAIPAAIVGMLTIGAVCFFSSRSGNSES